MISRVILLFLLPLSCLAETSSYRCYELEGSKIIAEDGTFLGRLGESYETNSIYNEYSDHGNTYGGASIWNKYSDFGNEYGNASPFNSSASKPPILLKNGKVIGKLTTNSNEYDGVDPRSLGDDCGWK